jgi:hypothetical protein
MALAGPGLLNCREELGKSLFDADYKEGRLTRLLQARASDLPDMVPRLVRYLAAKGQTLNPVGLAYFIWAIGKGGEPAEQARERIARHYYRAEYQAGKTPQPSASIGSSAYPLRADPYPCFIPGGAPEPRRRRRGETTAVWWRLADPRFLAMPQATLALYRRRLGPSED